MAASKRPAEAVDDNSRDADGASDPVSAADLDLARRREEGAKRQKLYASAKRDLGEAFGTKKAQKIQRSRESNVVDTSGLGSVLGSLVEDINAASAAMPSAAEVKAKQDSMRPVPPHDLTAETPDKAYPIAGIMLPHEIDAIKAHCEQIRKATATAPVPAPAPDDAEDGPGVAASGAAVGGGGGGVSVDRARLQLLATGSSRYLSSKLRQAFSQPGQKKPEKLRIRTIYYASCLAALYLHRRSVGDREKLAMKLRSPPAALLDSLLARFAAGGKVVDARDETRLLTHLFVLCLHLDGFALEPRLLQEDLGLRPPAVATLLKELGCTLQPITETQRVQRGLSKAEARQIKRAVLRAPLVFPEIKRGGPPKK